MWRVLQMDQRQVRELEIYSGIEPIGWDVSVSRPPEPEAETVEPDAGKEAAIAAGLHAFLNPTANSEPRATS